MDYLTVSITSMFYLPVSSDYEIVKSEEGNMNLYFNKKSSERVDYKIDGCKS